MRGSVKQQSSGSWRIVYDVPDPSGKRKQKAETIRGTKKEAEKVLRERIAAVENGGYVPKHKETVAQFLGDWLSTYVTTNTRPRTQETYRGVLNRYVIPAIGALQIQKLSGRHIQAIYADMAQRGLSSRTIKQTHVVLKGALAYGVKQGIMAQNVASTATAPRPEHREESEMWDSSTINRFLEAAKDNRFLPVYHLAILTGMRRAELCGLKWVSVDLIKGRLIVVNTLNRVGGKGLIDGEPKTPRSRRSITLSPEAISLLHEVRGRQIASQAALNGIWQGSGYVFTQADGTEMCRQLLANPVIEEFRFDLVDS